MDQENKKRYIPSDEEKESLYRKLKEEAEQSGYFLGPDRELVITLMHGLLVNQERFGYMSCPCRLASGKIDEDRDMICPCDYRDPDLDEYETCYCSLYVSERVAKGEHEVGSIPERRPSREERLAAAEKKETSGKEITGGPAYPVWRCKVCGYLAARDNPPGVCPICKATRERFERFV
ncbi:MAG TPA: ferredoxin-thioredoxin reductase catalytic domain-containing protein [Synergistales bacterium]|nr:ferredoxin-thioredoxin reductase catalytic domain-containing protein [Synergistales bacterium]